VTQARVLFYGLAVLFLLGVVVQASVNALVVAFVAYSLMERARNYLASKIAA
jgi:hypothetical protein